MERRCERTVAMSEWRRGDVSRDVDIISWLHTAVRRRLSVRTTALDYSVYNFDEPLPSRIFNVRERALETCYENPAMS